MSATPKILAFAGSLRRASFNLRLVKEAQRLAEEEGAEVTHVDLGALDLPMLNEDLEQAEGLPTGAKELKGLMKAHDGFLIAAPEYNSSITAVLKNAIDWASRPEKGETPLVAFRGKTAALLAASPGALGGLRGLVTVRSILGNIGVHVMPDQYALSKANEAFDDAGRLKDAQQVERVRGVVRSFVRATARLAAD